MKKPVLTAIIAFLCLTVASSALAQIPAPLDNSIIACRKARIAARQALDLTDALVGLGLTDAQAKDYLKNFQRAVDGCETSRGHVVSAVPDFPSPGASTSLTPESLRGPGTLPADPPALSVAGTAYPQLAGPLLFLNELEAYREALLKQCGFTSDLAHVAPSKALFDNALEKAAFGRCGAGAARGTNKGQNPMLPSFSSGEKQCHANVMEKLKSLAIDDCPNNPLAAGAKGSQPKISTDDEAIKFVDGKDEIPTKFYNDNKKPTTSTSDASGTTTAHPFTDVDRQNRKTTTVTVYVHRDRNNQIDGVQKGVVIEDNATQETLTEHDNWKVDANGNVSKGDKAVIGATGGVLSFIDVCQDAQCNTRYGPAHPKTDTDLDRMLKRMEQSSGLVKIGIEILRELKDLFSNKKRCVRLPGQHEAFYKDTSGLEFDVTNMITQCSCQAKMSRCPACSGIGMHATACESAAEKERRECLESPFGQHDEVRKECVGLLQDDNGGASLTSLVCGRMLCSGTSELRIGITARTKVVGCGCFVAAADLTPSTRTNACAVMQCAEGRCTCEADNTGRQSCGCVVADPPVGGGPPPPPFEPPRPPR
jgi:hypothetical protein